MYLNISIMELNLTKVNEFTGVPYATRVVYLWYNSDGALVAAYGSLKNLHQHLITSKFSVWHSFSAFKRHFIAAVNSKTCKYDTGNGFYLTAAKLH